MVGGYPVEVQQAQGARRAAEVMHPGHRLLASITALLQVYRGGGQLDLRRQGAVVGVEADSRDARGDAMRLVGPHPGTWQLRQLRTRRDQQVGAELGAPDKA